MFLFGAYLLCPCVAACLLVDLWPWLQQIFWEIFSLWCLQRGMHSNDLLPWLWQISWEAFSLGSSERQTGWRCAPMTKGEGQKGGRDWAYGIGLCVLDSSGAQLLRLFERVPHLGAANLLAGLQPVVSSEEQTHWLSAPVKDVGPIPSFLIILPS